MNEWLVDPNELPVYIKNRMKNIMDKILSFKEYEKSTNVSEFIEDLIYHLNQRIRNENLRNTFAALHGLVYYEAVCKGIKNDVRYEKNKDDYKFIDNLISEIQSLRKELSLPHMCIESLDDMFSVTNQNRLFNRFKELRVGDNK